ncbi:polysaccharide biosynthesis/export family protein [Noviherbaspirillum malthae]|uniref:polysaccharide biosynthesis/export family protein n=1 Tax=Noviherbaspirillum malthae TaxID=1260987 RepID=UPI001E5F987F|nr:polysaccharide biosynthesis/export family protein [Noviherbaspirillum malthae]
MRLDPKRVPSTTARPQPTPVIKLITPELVQAEKAAKAQQYNQNLNPLLAEPQPYVIGNGDLLSILVWNHPELNIAAAGAQALSSSSGAQTPAAFVVDQNGVVQFPYVGAIKLAGLTELQARNLLAERLVESIKRPDITLRVAAFRSKKIFVDGDVKTPGNQAIDDVPMTLLEGLTRAGGVLPTGDQSHIVVTRGGVSYPVNLPLLVKQGIDPSRILLAHGDVVRVRSRDENKIYVLGEVTVPKALPMQNGRMTLTEALGEAGGLNQLSSAARQVYVIRNASDAEPIVYNLDAQSPVALAMAENFELNPRDVVFVDASGLARFNRIVSLIIPTAATAATSIGQIR